MATSQFSKDIKLFPKNSNDLNIIFSISYAEYKGMLVLMNALTIGSSLSKTALIKAITSLDNAMYSTIMKSIGVLNSTMKKILPSPLNKNMTMSVDVGAIGNLLTVACLDYFGSIPTDLFNIFQDIKNNINKLSSLLLGPGLMNSLAKDLLRLKDEALNSLIGDEIFNFILAPLITWELFLKENGILDMINRMKKIERCMVKAGVANYPRSKFIHSGSKKLYSAYYEEQFLLNTKGKLTLKTLGIEPKKKAQMANVMRNLQNFRLTIK